MRARLTCLDGRPSANRTQPSHVPLDRRDPARASRIRTSAAMPQTRTPTLSRVRPSTHTSDPIARRSVGTKPTKPHTEPPLSTRPIPTALALLVGPPASISHILSCASDKTGTPPETSSARVLERWAAADPGISHEGPTPKQEIKAIRDAMKQKDREFLAPYGGFGPAMKRLAALYKMPKAKVTEGVSIDDYSTWRAVRFAEREGRIISECAGCQST